MERKDIDKKYKWDLTAIYPSQADFEREYTSCGTRVKAYAKYEKTIAKSAKGLYDALSELYSIDKLLNKLWEYAFLNFSTDSTNNQNQINTTKMRNLAVELGTASWFVEPSILKLDASVIDRYFSECPELESYRRVIEKIQRKKPHTLSDECEMLMSKLEGSRGSHSNIRSRFTTSDLRS